jgi:DNA-binding SARP family transcriptional activator
MDLLWPDLEQSAAAANLRKAVHYARHALGPRGMHILSAAGDLLRLEPTAVWIDVDAFRSAVALARRSGDPAAYQRAVALYRDGLLPEDPYADWASAAREELRSEFAQVLEEYAALLEAHGELQPAIDALRRLIAEDPWREEPRAHLIRLHALSGHRAEAVEEYRHLRAALADLGVPPSPATERLVEEVRAQQDDDPALASGLWERVGDLRLLAGDTRGAVMAFRRAMGSAARGAGQARLHRKTASAWLMSQDPSAAGPHLLAAESQAIDRAERGRLIALRATEAWQRGDLDRAHRLALEAQAAAEERGDADGVAAAEETLAIVAHLRGDWRQGLAAEIARSAPGAEAGLATVSDIHSCIGQYHLYSDELNADVESYARRMLHTAQEARALRAEGFAWCLLGEALLLQARWEEAAGCLQRSCELIESLAPNSAAALPWQRLAELAVCRGRAEEVEPLLRRAAAVATVSPMARHLWGRIHATAAFAALERAEPAAATAAVRAAAATAVRYGDCPTCGALLNPMAAEAYAQLGDPAAADVYARAAAAVATSFGGSAWRAMAEHATGAAASAAGDPTAPAHFARAAELYTRAGQPYWAARARARADAVPVAAP